MIVLRFAEATKARARIPQPCLSRRPALYTVHAIVACDGN
jgi:hypothetical protein